MFVRITLVAGALLGTQLLAAPALTTIQDVLYRADGTRFNGTLQIAWNSFEAADTSDIAMQGLTVRVVDGTLRVQLVPNISAGSSAYYTVKYNSDGRVQFQETWAVPQSSSALRVRDVRVNSSSAISAPVTTLQETDVTGLSSDLNSRPMKGAGYTPGHAAFINSSGLLEGVSGDAGDCVHVDGSASPCGDALAFTDGETPGGIVDGANMSFTLSAAPNPATSLTVFRNGMLQKAGQDYSISGNTVQFVPANAPQPGDTLLAWYRLLGGNGTSPQLKVNAKQALAAPVASGPEVLCAGTGAGTGQASCPIAAGTLAAGDRVEIRFDYARAGDTGGFGWEIHWGATTVASGNPNDALITGRVDAAVHESGAQVSWQAWGSTTSASSGVVSTASPLATTIDFRGTAALLRNFTVLRYLKK